MRENELQRKLREQLGVRVGTHTAEYVQRRLESAAGDETIAIIGCDARTGLAARLELPCGQLRSEDD